MNVSRARHIAPAQIAAATLNVSISARPPPNDAPNPHAKIATCSAAIGPTALPHVLSASFETNSTGRGTGN